MLSRSQIFGRVLSTRIKHDGVAILGRGKIKLERLILLICYEVLGGAVQFDRSLAIDLGATRKQARERRHHAVVSVQRSRHSGLLEWAVLTRAGTTKNDKSGQRLSTFLHMHG